MLDFTVLMSVYYKENPEWFSRAMQSIWNEQIVKPAEIVLVQDGPLTPELDAVIVTWQEKLGEVLKCVPLNKNVGLGTALNIGLQHCTHELIARMDTDDISLPERFKKQLEIFNTKQVDVCSAWITEFSIDENLIESVKKTPELHDKIVSYAKLRSPINHIPVMFKKTAVLKSGGYQHMLWLEDYYLWVRMVLNGAKFYNIQKPLANIRAGMGQVERRSGIAYAKSELKLLIKFYELGFLSSFEFIKVLIIRLPVRLMPKPIIRLIYKTLR